jgi:Transcription factor WhiB
MSDAPLLSPPRSVACQRDPERWFDRRHRRDALVECLQCTVRPWCARQALQCRAHHGMWAGVWIDGRHSDAVPYLQALAADDAGLLDQRPAVTNMTPRHRPPARAPLGRPPVCTRSRSVPGTLLARSCGHCEVFAPSCRYTFDRVMTRRPNEAGNKDPCPAALFAACTACAEIVSALDAPLATRLGYLVQAGRDPARVPFLWLGARWVLLDPDGWLMDTHAHAQTA